MILADLELDLDVFQGPFDLLLTLVLRDEVELLDLPLVEVVTAALGERARERWDTDTAGELIVLKPGERRVYHTEISVLDGAGAIEHFRGKVGAVLRDSSVSTSLGD